MAPALNWREIEILAAAIRDGLSAGTDRVYLERIFVPERARFPGTYLKAEWALKLSGRKRDHLLVLSARPRRPYLALYPGGKALKNSAQGTRSPFDLEASRRLK